MPSVKYDCSGRTKSCQCQCNLDTFKSNMEQAAHGGHGMRVAAASSEVLTALQETLQGEREWRNIQPILKTSMAQVVAFLRELEARDARRQEREQDSRRREKQAMDAKLDAVRAEMIERMQEKQQEMQDALRQANMARWEQQQAELRELVDERASQAIARQWPGKVAGVQALMEEARAREYKEQQHQQQNWEQNLRSEMEDAAGRTARQIHKGESAMEALQRTITSLEQRLQRLQTEVTTTNLQVSAALQSKCSKPDVIKILQPELTRWKDQMAEQDETDGIVQRREVVEIGEKLAQKADDEAVFQLRGSMHDLVGIVESLQIEHDTIKTLVKKHVQDSNRAVELEEALQTLKAVVENVQENAANVDQISQLETQVRGISVQFRSELYQARFVWKDGAVTENQAIQWTSMTVNTNASVFVWKATIPDAITTVVPGLYHLQLAFFSRNSPCIQVMVNHEPVLVRTENAAKRADQDGGFAQVPMCSHCVRRLDHSGGNLAGMDVTAFLALPARALLTVVCDAKLDIQGFMNLRKM